MSNELLNVMGGGGFIGSNYIRLYPNCLGLDRNDYQPKSNADILYFISTVDNYNVFENPHIDIDTNLSTLVTTLENWRNNYPTGILNFISSWFAYGNEYSPKGFGNENGPNCNGAKETDHCNPKGFYGITKRAAEQLLISYCETYN